MWSMYWAKEQRNKRRRKKVMMRWMKERIKTLYPSGRCLISQLVTHLVELATFRQKLRTGIKSQLNVRGKKLLYQKTLSSVKCKMQVSLQRKRSFRWLKSLKFLKALILHVSLFALQQKWMIKLWRKRLLQHLLKIFKTRWKQSSWRVRFFKGRKQLLLEDCWNLWENLVVV